MWLLILSSKLLTLCWILVEYGAEEFGVYFTCDLYSLCLSLGNMALEMESVEVWVALVSSKHSWANADLNVAMANESQGNRKIQESVPFHRRL